MYRIEENLQKLAKSPTETVRLYVAKHISSAETLLKMAYDESLDVLSAIASNPNTPAEALKVLAENYKLGFSEKLNIVENPNVSVEVLEILSHDSWVEDYVASHPKATGTILKRLSKSSKKMTRKSVAWNQNTPVSVLINLSRDEAVKDIVALNPNTPINVLTKLAAEDDDVIRLSVARNPATTEALLEKLAFDAEPRVAMWVLTRTNVSEELLQKCSRNLVTKGDFYPYGNLEDVFAERLNVSEKVLTILAESECFWIQRAVAMNPKTPVKVLIELVKKGYGESVARNPQASAELLEELSNAKSVWTRQYVAKHQNTAVETLINLGKNALKATHFQEEDVIKAVVNNPNLPDEARREILEEVAKKDTYYGNSVREKLANPNTASETIDASENIPEEVLRELAKIENDESKIVEFATIHYSSVRKEVANNPITSEEILGKLAKDEDDQVRVEVAKHSKATVEILGELAKDDNNQVRVEVAKHPMTSEEILGKLAKDDNDQVRVEVAKHPNATVEILGELANDENDLVKVHVLKNPNISENIRMKVLEKLAKTNNATIKKAIVEEPDVSEDVLLVLLEDCRDNKLLKKIAHHPNAGKDVRDEVSRILYSKYIGD